MEMNIIKYQKLSRKTMGHINRRAERDGIEGQIIKPGYLKGIFNWKEVSIDLVPGLQENDLKINGNTFYLHPA